MEKNAESIKTINPGKLCTKKENKKKKTRRIARNGVKEMDMAIKKSKARIEELKKWSI